MHVLIADDQIDVRSALKLVFEQEFDTSSVGEVEDAEHLLSQVRASHPDIVMLDWELPGLVARETVVQLHTVDPEISVVVLSGRPEVRAAALEAGADAFVSKVDSPHRLLRTLRKIGALNGNVSNSQ